MLMRVFAWGVMAMSGAMFVGLLVFGGELPSYLASSAVGVRSVVKESVPLEFELQRARDLLDTMMPEIHSKIRLVAHEEVEVASLKKQIKRNEQQLASRGRKLQAMRTAIKTHPVSATGRVSGEEMRRLSDAFKQYKEADNLLASQRELLLAREDSLRAAMDALDEYRSEKALIDQKIESLAARHRLLEVRSAHTPLSMESGKLVRIEELLTEVGKRIDVASRILDHQIEMLPVDAIPYLDEADLLAEVDLYLESPIGSSDSEAVTRTASDDEVERFIE